jgi:8-oxo-dGTP pyrophosphatase MutT (NUDIX family)
MPFKQLNDLSLLESFLIERLRLKLPGQLSHQKMIPEGRINIKREVSPDETIRFAAVLIALFVEDQDIKTIFIKRNTYDGVHSGQIAFPGGRLEPTDPDLVFTALREAEEEVNITSTSVTVLGHLSRIYIPPSRFEVLPVIGSLKEIPKLKPDKSEVEEVFTCNLKDLLNPAHLHVKPIRLGDGRIREVPCISLGTHIIWGATSMIISELIDIVSEMDINQE